MHFTWEVLFIWVLQVAIFKGFWIRVHEVLEFHVIETRQIDSSQVEYELLHQL